MTRKGKLYKHFSKRLFAVETLHVHSLFREVFACQTSSGLPQAAQQANSHP